MTTIEELISRHASNTPDAPAIGAPGRADLSYRGLVDETRRVAEALASLGVKRGDCVAQVMVQGAEAAVAFLGAACAAACAPVNTWSRAEELERAFEDLEARAVMLDPDSAAGTAGEVAKKLGLPTLLVSPQPGAPAGTLVLEPPPAGDDTAPTRRGPGDIALVLHTSGTTSKPKKVALSHANLCAGAANNAEFLSLTPSDRCFNAMSLFHIHGLVAALSTTLSSGGCCVCAMARNAAELLEGLETSKPTWYTAAPAVHRAILDAAAEQRDLPAKLGLSLRFIRSSSAPLPTPWTEELERLFEAPVLQAYGMTETAYLICSNPLPPAARKAGSVGVPVGLELQIVGENGEAQPVKARGEVLVRGASVFSSYGDAEQDRQAFADGWFRTGDQGCLDEDGHLHLTGRTKELVNRGGEKVSPYEVEEVLLRHPAVAQAVVFPVPHETLGEGVAAAVVTRSGKEATEEDLRSFASQHLTDYKVPDRIIRVSIIPIGQGGKVRRGSLADQLALDLQTDLVPPTTPVEQAVALMWKEVLGQEVGLKDSFFARGGNSLQATRVLARVRRVFGALLTLADLLKLPTLADLVEAILKRERLKGRCEKAAKAYLRAMEMAKDEAASVLKKP